MLMLVARFQYWLIGWLATWFDSQQQFAHTAFIAINLYKELSHA
jgi:hypothetical protein